MWLIPAPCASSHSAPEEVDSTSASSWLCQTLASSAGWNGMPARAATWRQRCKRTAWLRSLCGRISEPSTVARGVEQWIASLRDTPVSHSAKPEGDKAQTILATCGRTSHASFEKSNPQSCFWKMSPAMYHSDSVKSSQNYTRWAIALRAESLRRRKLALRINGNECLCWPTPGANDHRGSAKKGQRRGQLDEAAEQIFHSGPPDPANANAGPQSSHHDPISRLRLNPNFVAWLMGWPSIGIKGCDFSATEWSLYKQHMRSALSRLNSPKNQQKKPLATDRKETRNS